MIDTTASLSLKALLNHTPGEDLVLRLYQVSSLANPTIQGQELKEASFTGYAPITLSGADWKFVESSPTFKAVHKDCVFVSTAGKQNQVIGGYYLTQAKSGIVVFSEPFVDEDAPYVIARKGDSIHMRPTLLGPSHN